VRGHAIYLNLAGQSVVVVGGGEVAERKVRGVLECGAEVTVIAPEASGLIREWARTGEITWAPRSYRAGDLKNARLVYAATDQREVNRAVAEEARAERALVNVADQPALCDFYAPAVVRRGDLAIAVSTGGTSPALARRIREELEERFGPHFESAIDELGALRERLRAEGRPASDERAATEAILNSLMPRR
jgi:precorrin-2 dehydrogenase/sirohydrochlorin ferrochelatase